MLRQALCDTAKLIVMINYRLAANDLVSDAVLRCHIFITVIKKIEIKQILAIFLGRCSCYLSVYFSNKLRMRK